MYVTVINWENRTNMRVMEASIGGVAVMAASMLMQSSSTVSAAYHPGDIATKTDVLVQMIKELTKPVGVGMMTWASIRYMLNQRGEAKEMVRGVCYGCLMLKMGPWLMDVFGE